MLSWNSLASVAGEDGIDPQVKEKLDQLKQQKVHIASLMASLMAKLYLCHAECYAPCCLIPSLHCLRKAHASEDKDNISAGLVAMQQKLMEMEVDILPLPRVCKVHIELAHLQEDKLNVDCQSTKKKVFKIVVVGDVHVGKVTSYVVCVWTVTT